MRQQSQPRGRKHRFAGLRSGTAPGTSPGTLTPPPNAQPTAIRLIAYDRTGVDERKIATLAELETVDPKRHWWIDVVGLGDIEQIQALGQIFGLHPLALEDVVNTHQRPKAEEFDNQLSIVTRMPPTPPDATDEQIAIFIGDGFLVTFQERPGDCFENVRDRLRRGHGRMRGSGTDYLAYALIDAVIDHYFPMLEQLGEKLDTLEDAVIRQPNSHLVEEIHSVKRELLNLRRALWPQREMLNTLTREDVPHIHKATKVYLRNCYGHVTQLMDIIENCREIASGLVDMHLSASSTRLNEIMKVLTVIASIFIPLSFIAGIYGMNFDPAVSAFNMPELSWRFGYPFALGLMAATAVGLLAYFRSKRWIGAG